LVRDEIQVMGVDGRDDERNKGVLAIVLGVGEHRDFGLDEFHLCEGQLRSLAL
jgi:hypothetical protein